MLLVSPDAATWKLWPALPTNWIEPEPLSCALMPVAASAALPAIAVLILARVVVSVSVVAKLTEIAPAVPVRPVPVIFRPTVSAAAGAANVAAAVAVTSAALPVEPLEKLPSSAVATWSPPWTWKAVEALLAIAGYHRWDWWRSPRQVRVLERRCLLAVAVARCLDRRIDGRYQRVGIGDAVQIDGHGDGVAAAGVGESRTCNGEVGGVVGDRRLVGGVGQDVRHAGGAAAADVGARLAGGLHAFEAEAFASTVAWLRSTPTLPLVVAETPLDDWPPPMNTLRLVAKLPPWFKPIACAWRLISPNTLWNSVFNTLRSPVKVPEADSVASDLAVSRRLPMLLMPLSAVCNSFCPLVAFWIPCVSTDSVERSPLAIAKPAASSPELTMRKPEVTWLIVWLWKVTGLSTVVLPHCTSGRCWC